MAGGDASSESQGVRLAVLFLFRRVAVILAVRLLDLLDEGVRPRGFLQGSDLRIIGQVRADFLGDALQDLQRFGALLFRQEVDLLIELIAPLGHPHFIVLADEDECGQKDRLE